MVPSPPTVQSSQSPKVPTLSFYTKRQRRDYYREVNHVVVKGPFTQTKWSHISITFSTEDVNLVSFPHIDAMVLTVHIDRWDASRILIDNGSQAKILFLSAFEKWAMTRNSSKNGRSPSMASEAKELSPSES
jgi:hypothetical protein